MQRIITIKLEEPFEAMMIEPGSYVEGDGKRYIVAGREGLSVHLRRIPPPRAPR